MEPKSRRISPRKAKGWVPATKLNSSVVKMAGASCSLRCKGVGHCGCRLPCKRWRKERRSLSLARAA